jgi:general secretion pathway protein G
MSTTNRRRTRRSAFTLIELLLVLVILAVLATIVVVNFNSIFGQSDSAKVKTDISNLETAIDMYRTNCGDYPQNLDALVHNPGATNWQGPYIKKGVPNDPWGHPYVYACPGAQNANTYDLSSGGDGKKPPDGLNNWTVDGPKK